MNINRNTYEEFFLLYVDNELSQAERRQVEAFIEENPDLRPELDMLHDVVLRPEESTRYFARHEPVTNLHFLRSGRGREGSHHRLRTFIQRGDDHILTGVGR